MFQPRRYDECVSGRRRYRRRREAIGDETIDALPSDVFGVLPMTHSRFRGGNGYRPELQTASTRA